MTIPVKRAAPLLLACALAVGAIGCGSSKSSSSSSGGSGGGADVAGATALVNKYLPVQSFTPPGPSFDTTKARGKTVFILPVSSNVPFNVLTGEAMTKAIALAGVKAITYSDQGQPSQWVQGMNTAIARKVDLIDLIGLDPAAIAPQIAAAKQAGIPVLEDHFIDAKHPKPQGYQNVTARIPAPYIEAGKLSAAYAVKDTKGNANAIVITSEDILSAGDVVVDIKEGFKQFCTSCPYKIVNVPFNNWASQMQTATQSALVQNPQATYIIPVFDGMVQFAAPAVTAANATGRVKIASYNATPSVLQLMQQGNTIAMNSGESYDWLGWALADDSLRILTGNKPVPTENVKLRAFVKSNVNEAGTPPQVNKGYGSAYISGYKSLWGVK